MSHWFGPTLFGPPLSMVWQVKHCFMKIALPASTLALASKGSIGGSSSAGAAAAVSVGASSATANAGFSSLCTGTTALETLPTTIAKSAEARTQPATVLKLAIVKSQSAKNSGRCCSMPACRPVVSDRRVWLARRNVASLGFCEVFRRSRAVDGANPTGETAGRQDSDGRERRGSSGDGEGAQGLQRDRLPRRARRQFRHGLPRRLSLHDDAALSDLRGGDGRRPGRQ